MMMSENQFKPIINLCDNISGFWVLSAKKPVKNATQCLYLQGGSVLTQYQSRDTETDGQRNTHDRSSGQPGALPEISNFTQNAVRNILQHHFRSGEDG